MSLLLCRKFQKHLILSAAISVSYLIYLFVIARNQLKAALLMELESPRNFFLDFGLQAIITGQVLSATDLTAAIDKITTADVQNVSCLS